MNWLEKGSRAFAIRDHIKNKFRFYKIEVLQKYEQIYNNFVLPLISIYFECLRALRIELQTSKMHIEFIL